MKNSIAFAGLALLMIVFSCGNPEQEHPQEAIPADYILSRSERLLCDSLGLDSAVIVKLRDETNEPVNQFNPELIWVKMDDGSVMQMPAGFIGIYFEADQTKAKGFVSKLGDELRKLNYTIYVCEENFGVNGAKDKVAIVSTTDMYDILRGTGTDGINFDISNDSLCKIIHRFDDKYELTLIGCNYDWCEFTFSKEPASWTELANECYAVCPDIVDQGTGSVEELAKEIKRTRTLYFWWD